MNASKTANDSFTLKISARFPVKLLKKVSEYCSNASIDS